MNRKHLLLAIATLAVGMATSVPAEAQQTRDVRNLLAATILPGDSEPVNFVSRYGEEESDWTVPSDDVFLIKTVTITPLDPGNGSNSLTLVVVNGSSERSPIQWVVTNASTSQFTYEPGIVVGDGAAIRVLNESGSAGEVSVHFNGYLGQPRGVKRVDRNGGR